jgi:IS5 family transposase
LRESIWGVHRRPDETTICKFRHLLEEHDLCGAMLDAVNRHLDSRGIRIATGTIVDATIIHAPSSTKNAKSERGPQMHQTRKGNQWYFGMKAHVGVDSKSGIVHSVCTTAASVADKHMLADLLHGEERKVSRAEQNFYSAAALRPGVALWPSFAPALILVRELARTASGKGFSSSASVEQSHGSRK